jgi:selenium metabolism protein YedF
MVEVNCIGQKCPLPLINTKKTLVEHPNEVLVITIDNEISCNNLESYLADNGIEFSVVRDGKISTITTGNKTAVAPLKEPEPYCSSPSEFGYIVVLDKTEMGQGSSDLGAILLKGFLTALSENETLPVEVICYNSGVTLASSESIFCEYLKKLKDKGVKITLCGTCVDFYSIKDKLVVGEISNMYYILNRLNSTLKIVKP